MTLHQAADGFVRTEPFTPTDAGFAAFKLQLVLAHSAWNIGVKSLETQILT